MAITASQLVAASLARMQATEPAHAAFLAQLFAKKSEFIEPMAQVILLQSERDPIRLQLPEADARLVEQLIRTLQNRSQIHHAWASRNAEILKLLVRTTVSQLFGTGPTSLESAASQAWTPPALPISSAERLRINAEAINIVARGVPPTPAQRRTLQQYTGNGGVSLNRLREMVPAEWAPDSKASVDEYYTPPIVCSAVASLVALLFEGQPVAGPALEPAAGIGRFVGACLERPELRDLTWSAVEYSRISAEICRLLYPSVDVHNKAFEQWVVENHQNVAGQLALTITNPPFGVRGANKTVDPDKSYREPTAAVYFIRRPFDMLRAGGIGVAIVPRGFMSGTGAAAVKARSAVLLRHHLICAFRLPSDIYPGAEIVTDVSFWRARGGELSHILGEDEDVLAGRYFEIFPEHVLGEEKVSERGRHSVLGTFNGFPRPAQRVQCQTCTITPFITPVAARARHEDTLDEETLAAHQLGLRVEQYLDLAGSSKLESIERAARLHGELLSAVRAWHANKVSTLGTYTPHRDAKLRRESRHLSSIAALLSVFTPEGALTAALLQSPSFVPSYAGAPTAIGHAEWLYAKERHLTLAVLHSFRQTLGFVDSLEDLETELSAQGWCQDWQRDETAWYPPRDYYSGDLWPKLDRARLRGSQRAHAQVAKLLDLIGVVTPQDAAPTLRDPWVPPDVVQGFVAQLLNIEVPPLHWYRSLLKPETLEYSQMGSLDERLQTVIGYINHDMEWFHPPYRKQTDPSTGQEESAEAAKDRARLAYGSVITERFRFWLNEHTDIMERVLDAYLRNFRGYVAPIYGPEPLPIARWGSRIKLKPHQTAGAWRLIRNNGGLLAFDVGVGKTYTGIATLSYLREIGRARRPLVIVPNSILWKWYREIMRALPDYRVVVIGAVRYLTKTGLYRSRIDDAAERARKWSEFKQGLYDVALCSYSMFGRTAISDSALRQFIDETPTLLRELGMRTARLETELESLNKLYDERELLAKKVEALTVQLQMMPQGAGGTAAFDSDDFDDQDAELDDQDED